MIGDDASGAQPALAVVTCVRAHHTPRARPIDAGVTADGSYGPRSMMKLARDLALFLMVTMGGAVLSDRLIGASLPGDACHDTLVVTTIVLLVLILLVALAYIGVVVAAALNDPWSRSLFRYGSTHALGAGAVVFSAMTPIIVLHGPESGKGYGGRVAVIEGLEGIRPLQNAVQAFWIEHQRFPASSSELQLHADATTRPVALESVGIERGGVISLHFASASPRYAPLNGTTLVLSPTPAGTRLLWDCRGGSLPDAMRPQQCRKAGVCGGGTRS